METAFSKKGQGDFLNAILVANQCHNIKAVAGHYKTRLDQCQLLRFVQKKETVATIRVMTPYDDMIDITDVPMKDAVSCVTFLAVGQTIVLKINFLRTFLRDSLHDSFCF